MRFTHDTQRRLRWQDDALCAQGDLDAYFPGRRPNAELKRKCKEQCPVTAECLEFALATDAVGIWGGTSTKERRKLKEQRGREAARAS